MPEGVGEEGLADANRADDGDVGVCFDEAQGSQFVEQGFVVPESIRRLRQYYPPR
jgi:hypothetical protein